MNVLIVARTEMGGLPRRCIGGLAANGDSVRLLTSTGGHWQANSPFQVGQIWDVDYTPEPNPVPPHVEDVRVSRYQFVAVQPGLRYHLLQRVTPWQGGVGLLFGGALGYTSRDNGYVSEKLGVPSHSTGYWLPDRDLALRDDGKHFDYQQSWSKRGLSYVGEPPPPAVLPAGTLVRVSLARWWKPPNADPDFEERCYLQLSGWFS